MIKKRMTLILMQYEELGRINMLAAYLLFKIFKVKRHVECIGWTWINKMVKPIWENMAIISTLARRVTTSQ